MRDPHGHNRFNTLGTPPRVDRPDRRCRELRVTASGLLQHQPIPGQLQHRRNILRRKPSREPGEEPDEQGDEGDDRPDEQEATTREPEFSPGDEHLSSFPPAAGCADCASYIPRFCRLSHHLIWRIGDPTFG